MILHLKESTDTATVGGATLTGPGIFEVDSATVSTVEYTRGVVVVQAGTAYQVAQMTGEGIAMSFFGLVAGLAFGFGLARLWISRLAIFLILALPCLGDFHRHTQVVRNDTPEHAFYRATVYAVDESGGETYKHTHEVTQGVSAATNVGHSGGGTMRIRYRFLTSGNAEVSTHDIGIVTYINSGNPHFSGYNFVWPEVLAPEGAAKYERQWKRESPFFQSTYSNALTNITLAESTTEEVVERGAVLAQWPFEVAAHASITLNIEQTQPFFLVVEKQVWVGTPDGGYAVTYEEIEDDMSTEIVSSDEPESTTTASVPDYSPGETPEPAERPETVDSTSTLNQAQEARHTDEKAVLEQIRDAVTAGVNTASGAAKQARDDAQALGGKIDAANAASPEAESESEAAESAAVDAAESQAETIADALDGLSDAVQDLAGSWSLSVATAEFPVLEFPLPAKLGGGSVEMDFADWSGWFAILRAILLAVCVWRFIVLAMETIRQAAA